jgi:hypothetical protein
MRLLAVFLFLVVPVALAPVGAIAQQPQPAPAAAPAPVAGATTSSATVHGMVVDPDDALVPGATVTLTSASGKAQSTTSKSDGTYSFRGLAAGTYTLGVKATGFASYTKQAVRVAAGANLNQDAALSLAEQEQQVNVTTDTVTLSVDPENNASATVITGAALDALSDDPDELESELTALAGPSAGPNGGQIYIDGFTGGQLPPKSSILAIRINQNPFSAQYDQLGYGRIEILTKPGTSAFHGNFSGQYGGKVLNTKSPFVASNQPDYHTLFFMGNVTGPIKNGMSFTLSGSHRTMDNNSIYNPAGIYSSSPDSFTLCAPGDLTCTSNAFPIGVRSEATPATRWDISPRVDMMLGAKNTMTTRYQYESGSNSTKPPVTSALMLPSNSSSADQAIQIGDTQLISSKVINETRFEYEHSSSNSTTSGTGPSISTSTFGVGSGSQSNGTSNHIEVQNYTSVQLTKNFVRLGGRLRTSGESNYSVGGELNGSSSSYSYTYLLDPCTDPGVSSTTKTNLGCASTTVPCSGVLTTTPPATPYSPISSYQCNIVNSFGIVTYPNPTISARETDVGLYAEDDWKAKPNLTISYGIRFEAQNVINSSHDFAPRVSLAYGIPRKNGKTITVLRGGFGVFYNRFGLGSIAGQIANNGQNSQSYTYTNPTCQPDYSNGFFTAKNDDSCKVQGVNPNPPTTSPTVNDPNLRSAYTVQEAATLEQQLGKYTSATVTYTNSRGFHQFMSRSLPLVTTANGVTTVSTPSHNQSEGVFRQNQITASVNIRTPKNTSITGYYSANWADSNDGSMSDPFSSSVDYGRARFAVRSRMNLIGSFPLPFQITASPMLSAQSGTPYNITTGSPVYITMTGVSGQIRLPVSVRPAWNTANGPMPAYGSFSQCINSDNFSTTTPYVPGGVNNQIPLNFCTGPASVSLNMRLSRTFGFGPKTAAAQAAAAARQQAGGAGGPGGPGGAGGPGGGGGGRGGGGGFGGGGGGGGGGRGGGGGGGGRGGGSNTGRKYNLTVSAFAQNLFNEVPYSAPGGSLSSPRFGQVLSVSGGNSVRRITMQANFSF